MKTWVTLLGLLLAAPGWAEGDFVYAGETGGRRIAVIDPATEEARFVAVGGTDPVGIFPTPGGKFVFVTFRGSREVSVIDAETLAEHRVFAVAEGIPESIVFSPMGQTAFVSLAGEDRVLVFDHRRSELTPRAQIRLGAPDAEPLFNRRGTRYYRSTPAGLAFVLETTGELIKEVRHPEGPADWSFTPDHRSLWGVGRTRGAAVVVDERRGVVSRTIPGPFAPVRPVLTADGRALLLTADGRTVHSFDVRNGRPLGITALAGPVSALVATPDGKVWVGVPGGVGRLEAPGVRAVLDLRVGPLAVVALKPGEGFACF